MSYGAILGGTAGTPPYGVEILDTDGTVGSGIGQSALSVAADDEYFYAAIGSKVYKYDRTLTEVWNADHGDTIRAIAVDADGNVYIGGNRTSNLTHRKCAANDGSFTWSKDHGDTVYAIAVDGSGNVFIGGFQVSGNSFRKYNSSGTLQWSKNTGGSVYAVAVDADGNSYEGGVRASSLTHRKFDSGGTQQWAKDHGAGVLAMATDGTSVYIGGERTSSLTHRKLDASDGTVIWSKDHGGTVRAVAVDGDGAVWIGGNQVSSVTHRKLDIDGEIIWSADHGYQVNSLAIYTIPGASSPGLSLPISLAVPFPTGFSTAPALSLSLRLSAPETTAVPLPPDWTGPPPQSIYRCYLTGGTTLLELPMDSLQSQRRVNDSTWITVSVPTYSATLAAAIAERALGQIVIYAGERAADGTETLGEMMRAWLTETETTEEAGAARILLTGRLVPTPFTTQSRTLYDVQSLGETDGRWRVVCAVDPRLRPNDTAIMDGDSFTVGAIDYEISPHASVMTVTEVVSG